MGKITFHVDLDNRVKKDGTQNIQLRITQAKKKLRVAVGFSVQKIHWNDEKKEVRRTHPLHSQINNTIKSKLLEVERTYLKSQVTSRKVTASTLQKQLKKEIAGESFVQYSKLRAQQITNPSSRSACKSVLSNLDVYLKGKDLLFEEIDYDWIKDYERYLKKLSNATNTIYNNLKPLKASYNEAIKSGLFVPDKMSPWMRYEGKKAKSVRTRLTIEQIALLEKLNLRPGTNKFQAHNFFLFSFYLQGMRVSDVLQLKWANIINERLEYKASKTEKSRSKKIIQKAAEILNIYRKPRQKPTENIFPFLKDLKERQFADDVWRKN